MLYLRASGVLALRGGEGADGGQQIEGGADRRDVVDYHGALAIVVAHRYTAEVHLHVGHHAPEGGRLVVGFVVAAGEV